VAGPATGCPRGFAITSLDKIEQQTGRILEYEYFPLAEMGQSTIPFDATVVLYSKLRPNLNKVVEPDRAGYATSELVPLLPDTDRLTREYLAAYLRSTYFVAWAVSKVAGAKMPRLSPRLLMDASLPLPSLDRQREIAAVLDRICALKRNAEAQLAQLKLLAKSRFVEMFEGKTFPLKRLDYCVEEMFIGPFGSALKNECFVEQEKGFCMVYEQKHAIHKDMTVPARYVDRLKYEELKRFTVLPGDLIVSCRGTVGEVFAIPEDAPMGIMHPSIMKIRLKPNVFDSTYFIFSLRRYMKENAYKAQGSGVKMAVTATVLGKECFAVPPIDLQRKFSAFIEQLDKSAFAVNKLIEQYDLLYRAKLQEYFG